jgi:nucleotide-binding universal stress UspA family protein
VYEVPIGYYKSGKSYEEFGEIMQGHAVRHYEAFMRKQNLRGLEVKPVFALDARPSRGVLETADSHRADLIVTGTRGRGLGAGVLIGSVTERLIAATDIPLLAAKKKGAGMSLLEALLEL